MADTAGKIDVAKENRSVLLVAQEAFIDTISIW
jgi:hypothetical protein